MKIQTSVFFLILCLGISLAEAKSPQVTARFVQFKNQSVEVWKTIIYPNNQQKLALHRHNHNRVLIALTDGVLKITNNHGKVHYLHLKKDTAYYLKKDIANETHTDENTTRHPIKVMVVELLDVE